MKNSQPSPSTLSRDQDNQLWMVPSVRNPLFTGRETELQEMREALEAGQNGTNGVALSGAGGSGKSQLALEYAFRHREEYRYVFWVLATSREALSAAYSDIAELLALPEKGEHEQFQITKAVTDWLANNPGWLLILDDANDLSLLKSALPATFPGHLLLTTRNGTTGKLARRIKLKKLNTEDSSRLLLSRSGLLSETTSLAETGAKNYEGAGEIAAELVGLPLALDLAGAYIAATACGLPGYLELLRRKPRQKNYEATEQRADPLERTVALAYEKVAKASPVAADLLHLCAFLAPDEILETLLVAGASVLNKPLQRLINSTSRRNAALALLQKYALITRDTELQALALSREVQRIVRERLPEDEQRAWAEQAVRLVGTIFPALEVSDWEACQRLLPHALLCIAWIERWQIKLVEGAWLLHHAGWYLHTRAEYAQAQECEEKALAIYRALFGDEHPSTAMILNNLAVTYEDRGRLKDAAALHQQALAIRRSTLGENHPDTAASLRNLALIHHSQGKLDDAATLYRQALAIQRQLSGDEHPEVATTLTQLAALYHQQNKFDDAIALHQQALAIRRKVLGKGHPETLAILSNLAAVYQSQNRFDEAEFWLRQALTLQRKMLGHTHLDVATTLHALAIVYQSQEKLDDAAFWLQQALAIQREILGNEQAELARSLETLAILYEEQEQSEKAEALYQQALAIYHRAEDENRPDIARCSYNLALLYQEQKYNKEARPLLEQALAIWQERYGPDHSDTKKAREKYEQLQTKTSVTRAKREEKLKQGEAEKQAGKRGIKGIVRKLKGSAQAK